MSIDLHKRVVELSKKAAFAANQHGISEQRVQVVLVLDISKSMHGLYHGGIMQRVIERILGLALNFDDDGSIDLLLFGSAAYRLPPVTLEQIDGYVARVILSQYKIIEATCYAPALELLKSSYSAPQTHPVLVIFLTDGGNSDRRQSEQLLREMSKAPMFIQFVGIGKEDFPFLQKLDELSGRVVDNAGFMTVNDINAIRDLELYNRLLSEFPTWLRAARSAGIVRN